jgi:hypothetical protein
VWEVQNLWLSDNLVSNSLDLQKNEKLMGHWKHATLEKRLLQKHSRAAFIFAEVKTSKAGPVLDFV